MRHPSRSRQADVPELLPAGCPLAVLRPPSRARRMTPLEEDALAGLQASPKRLSPVWFYDERGSALFDEITRLPEYYPTRAERGLLRDAAPEIASLVRPDTLVELGS